ncbi:SusC/RagA family TonB-linked outer membrane protein [Aequorivita sp. H23M31]|uniref:SusC/RagA family TonB-linked outer membrane protein n=1 Tax=Aequorivita ciconiae TaxID=2494375 RepID=A0A410G2V7_9FLAO|nr:SusC/RagA family TonB-linked outer membrane protein [Aequorivita sp. H23M31]QAA81579.1 SusC/RagA family TonB-linked outer membrane protein [Aequorivita sp. H23M31]
MRTKFSGILTLLLALVVQLTFAQQKTITGNVTDDNGVPLPGVNVIIKNTNSGTQTDFDGNYSLQASVGQTLVFSYVGYDSPEIKIGASNSINVKMAPGESLEEVVIMGYDQSITKKESMGAQTTITAETFESRPSGSFLNTLQGNSPGAVIQSNSGSPGSAQIDVLIRGRNSINASSDPLIVVDGIVMGSAQFRNLNQNDFESVTILRDAHATSIYGNRGANGVIVITTKSGKFNQPLTVKYETMYGAFTLPSNDYNLADARQSLTLQKRVNTGLGKTLTDEEIANYPINTNWRDEFFSTGINTQHNLSFQQGSEKSKSYFSLGYTNVEGMVPTTDFQRFNVRANVDGKSANEKLTYEGSIATAYSKRHQLDSETNGGINNSVIQNPLFGSLLGLPYVAAGQYSSGIELFEGIGTNFDGGNSNLVLEDILRPGYYPNEFTETSILANFSVAYEIVKGLKVRNKMGMDYKHQTRGFARAPYSYLAIAVARGANLDFPGLERKTNTQDATFSTVTSLNYDETFGNHRIKAGAYMEYVKANYRYSYLQKYGLIERTWEFGAGTGFAPRDGDDYIPTVALNKIDAGSFSYFGTFDYEYDKKYGIGATIRRDATNKFVDSKKWGTFWSAAARWVISDEEFLSTSTTVNLLKLRASYGVTGNQILSIPAPDTNPLYLDSDLVYDTNDTGQGYMNLPTYFPIIGNSDVQWEETAQANIGLDWILFDNRLSGNLDVYQKITSKLFNQMDLSAITGQYSIKGNNGEITNKGVELNLRYQMLRNKDFNLAVYANGSYNHNEITALETEAIDPGGSGQALNGPVNQFYMYEYVGVNPENGELLFNAADGSVTENPVPEDAVYTGKSNLPKYVGGFGLNADYKGFYLDVAFSFQADFYKWDNALFWLYEGAASTVANYNVSADLLDAWTPENTNANFPSLTASNKNFDGSSDRYLFDASFVRLRSTVLGYSFPQETLDGTFIKGLNVFVQGENLLLWTKWRGFDPEGYVNYSLGQYPNPRTISFGVNLEF